MSNGLLPVQIPFFMDRANGLNGGIWGGTMIPDGAATAEGPGGSTNNTASNQINIFEEMPDSPRIDLGEQATVIKRFKCDPAQSQTIMNTYTRGNVYYDSVGRLLKVLNVSTDYQEGDYCIVTVTSEGLNFYIPPADFSCDPVLINPAAQKHPRYAPLQQHFLSRTGSSGSYTYAPFFPLNAINQAVLGLSLTQANVQTAALQNSANFYVDNGTGGVQQPSASPDLIAQASALELLKKLRRGQETFYLAGYKVTYSVFAYDPQDLDPGGRIEDPVASGNLPPEFWQDAYGRNSLTYLAQTKSPQFYQNGVSWFREADSQVYQRTWWRKTSTWLMGPAGGPITLAWLGNSATYTWTGQWDLQWYTPISPGTANYPPYDTDLNIS